MFKLNEELVRAFNINNYHYNLYRIMHTNFTVQNLDGLDGRDYITMTFADGMSEQQCVSYLNNLREKIIKEFYETENGAKKSFDLDCFPFNRINQGSLYKDKDIRDTNNRWQFKTFITPKVLFNLKSHLAHSMAKDIRADMDVATGTETYNDKKYIMCIHFQGQKPANEFAGKLLQKYNNSPSDLVKVKGNDVYIRDVFNDKNVDFIKSVIQDTAWLIGRCVDDDSEKVLKDMLTQFIYQSTGIKIYGYDRSRYLWGKEYSILIPSVKDASEQGYRSLNINEIKAINHAFGLDILNGITECVSENLPITSPEKRKGIYGIDFYNKDISNCVINTVLENSLVTQVGKDKYELVVKTSPQLIKLYIDNLKLGNIRRPSTPEIQVRPSTSWQQKADGTTDTQCYVKKLNPPPVRPKPTTKEVENICKTPYDILKEKVVAELQSRFGHEVCKIDTLVKHVMVKLGERFNLPKIYELKHVLPQLNREILNEVINQVPLKWYFKGDLSDLAKDQKLKPISKLPEDLDFIVQRMLSNYSPEVHNTVARISGGGCDSYRMSELIGMINEIIDQEQGQNVQSTSLQQRTESIATTSRKIEYSGVQKELERELQSQFIGCDYRKIININALTKQMVNVLSNKYGSHYKLPELVEAIDEIPLRSYFTGDLSDLAKDRKFKKSSSLEGDLDFIMQCELRNTGFGYSDFEAGQVIKLIYDFVSNDGFFHNGYDRMALIDFVEKISDIAGNCIKEKQKQNTQTKPTIKSTISQYGAESTNVKADVIHQLSVDNKAIGKVSVVDSNRNLDSGVGSSIVSSDFSRKNISYASTHSAVSAEELLKRKMRDLFKSFTTYSSEDNLAGTAVNVQAQRPQQHKTIIDGSSAQPSDTQNKRSSICCISPSKQRDQSPPYTSSQSSASTDSPPSTNLSNVDNPSCSRHIGGR